jgi:hypothetical protein
MASDIKRRTQCRGIESRQLRRIFGPKREEMTGNWRKLRNEELHDLCCSSDIRMIELRMGWVGHEARIIEKDKCIQSFRRKTLKERDHLEKLGVHF